MELWLIRHTKPKVDKGICYGQLDLDVDTTFTDEVAQIKDILRSIDISKVYSSPLMRCSKLAKALFPKREIKYDKRLMELNFGTWEGKDWSNIPLVDIDTWSENFYDKAPPEGESFQALVNRIESFESEVNAKGNENLAIVTHAGVIRAFVMKYLNIPADKIFSLQLNYGAIVKITIHTESFQQVEFIKG